MSAVQAWLGVLAHSLSCVSCQMGAGLGQWRGWGRKGVGRERGGLPGLSLFLSSQGWPMRLSMRGGWPFSHGSHLDHWGAHGQPRARVLAHDVTDAPPSTPCPQKSPSIIPTVTTVERVTEACPALCHTNSHCKSMWAHKDHCGYIGKCNLLKIYSFFVLLKLMSIYKTFYLDLKETQEEMKN